MSSFTTPFLYDRVEAPGSRFPVYQMTQPFAYEVGALGSGLQVLVPAGFRTDFASVPWPFRLVFKPEGRTAKAAALHDYLYQHPIVSRAAADLIFLEALKVSGVARHRRALYFAAVRAFGWRFYGRPLSTTFMTLGGFA